jgi:hypothetical protein
MFENWKVKTFCDVGSVNVIQVGEDNSMLEFCVLAVLFFLFLFYLFIFSHKLGIGV